MVPQNFAGCKIDEPYHEEKMAPKIINTQRESSFRGRMETQRLSYSYGRERHLMKLIDSFHGLRRLDQSFKYFEEM
jgi:hypothetical protein